jgi:hypothetical protein
MIPIVELIRLEENFDFGTFGVWRVNKKVFCVTLEPADLMNRRNVSSIPAQQYMVWRTSSPKYGEWFELQNVPDRDDVGIHPGNLIIDTEGCIILAEHYGKLGKNRAVLNSGKTYLKWMNLMHDHNAFHLTIKEYY